MSSLTDATKMHVAKCLSCPAKGNLGRRYECIVCGDSVTYCGDCYDEGKNVPSEKHKYYHPMKAIYNRDFFELYFLGEEMVNGEAPQSYKCAFCDELGFTAEELQLHVVEKHSGHCDAPKLLDILEQMNEQKKSTEIRCQEKSRGGLSYEVILAEPAPNVAVPKRPVTPGKNVSVEEIEQKLKAAEERRISLEARKMAEISIKLAKVEEATRKKDEITNEFITQTKEQLETKMETHVEKREAIISDMKEKLKIHAQEIEKTRETLEQQKANEQKAIEEKLKTAQALRDENIKKMLNRLKEHNTIKIAEIKTQNNQLENQKLEEKARIIENKLYTAEQNREKELLKKIEKAQKLERRAEVVRQNKAQTQDMEGQQSPIASSG
ncbi:PREDICTED: zinc finger protein DZIP1L isoform X1 [Drosophila arizonae]|uniref:Zinc finger protein DZIP1L isoform X1 n=1 Tax=Drosophila arizonae TaxID=7263 RepID=A0ABM1NQM3_DROAR|nr:PREDICTED: zinc finger protein DZIP1L isoform X1 [Drosophila arizonae]